MADRLSQGSQGEWVTYLQQVLETTLADEAGSGAVQLSAVDGIFGPITDASVRFFQEREGLTVDGIVGPITWGRIGELTGEDLGSEDEGEDASSEAGQGGMSTGWPVDHIAQQFSMSCWAACVAMLVNFRDGTTYNDDDICEAAGIEPQTGATDSDWEGQLIPQFGLSHVPGSCMTPQGWADLVASGPTIVGVTGHVVVCAGISTDGTEEGTELYMCDPAESSPVSWTFADATQRWELRANREIHMVQLA